MDFSNTQWEARRASLWHILCAQKELQFLLEEGQAETSSKDVYVATVFEVLPKILGFHVAEMSSYKYIP